MVTVTLKILQSKKYESKYLECLEELVEPVGVNQWQGWQKEVWVSLKAYLRRLSAQSQVLFRCMAS